MPMYPVLNYVHRHVQTQPRVYNVWIHGHCVTNVFVFFLYSTIGDIAINGPGCVHDSIIRRMDGVYVKCDNLYKKFRVRGAVDSAST